MNVIFHLLTPCCLYIISHCLFFFYLLDPSSQHLFIAPPPLPPPPPAPVLQLFIDYHCEYNPSGMWVVRAREVPVNDGQGKNEVVDVITLYQGVVDSRDAEDGKYSAKLHPSGKSVEVYEPTPKLFVHNVNEIHRLELDKVCEKTKMAHQIQATALLGQDPMQTTTKSKILRFPEGVVCTADIYNMVGTLKLHGPVLRKAQTTTKPDSAGRPTYGQATFIYWQMVVKGTRKVVTETKKNTLPDVDDINQRMNQLGPLA
jgi:hypothetical protein